MDRWGSSYLLHDSRPGKLIGGIGAVTGGRRGEVRLSFVSTPDVFAMSLRDDVCELVVNRELAFQLMGLVHVLLLQNRMLRGSPPVLPRVAGFGAFLVVGGGRQSLTCSWAMGAAGIRLNAEVGPESQHELLMREAVALQFMCALATGMAKGGTGLSLR